MNLFHIAEIPFWEAAQRRGSYRAASLDSEGFIHLSTAAQYVATANRYYRERTDLILLEVDPALLDEDSLRYEVSTNNEAFPHLYGEIPVDAIVETHAFAPEPDGSFVRPMTDQRRLVVTSPEPENTTSCERLCNESNAPRYASTMSASAQSMPASVC